MFGFSVHLTRRRTFSVMLGLTFHVMLGLDPSICRRTDDRASNSLSACRDPRVEPEDDGGDARTANGDARTTTGTQGRRWGRKDRDGGVGITTDARGHRRVSEDEIRADEAQRRDRL